MKKSGAALVPAALALAALLLATAILSLVPRRVAAATLELPGQTGWVADDADSFYHMRRLARLLDEGLPVAETDAFLNYPEGARIPWPPYYTLALAALIGPFVPDAPLDSAETRGFLERATASVPTGLGVLTSVLVALAGWVLAGPLAGLFAGVYHALCLGSIAYSRLGNGDHHAWVAMLMALLFLLIAAAFRRDAFDARARALRYATAAGVVAGVLLGSWVASLLYVLELQLVLGLLLLLGRKRPAGALAWFGLAFHLAALATILPAILTSPWKQEFPWMVVNLSWFHAAHLALGALVFVPLLFLRGARARARYPWLVAGAVALLALGVLGIDAGPGRGVREGFAWVSRADEFMSGIQESRPLLGERSAPGELSRLLGYGAWLFPLALLHAAWGAARGDLARLPWVVLALPLAAQAATQARFANSFAVPLAVLLGCFVAALAAPLLGRVAPPLKQRSAVVRGAACVLGGVLVAGLALALEAPTSVPIWKELRRDGVARGGPQQRRARGSRELLEWIREKGAQPADSYSVLANWSRGHAIEWIAGRPSVATNFGSYVGRDSYADPGRFFLAEDPARAEAVLERRRARYVFLGSQWPVAVSDMLRAAYPERASEYLDLASPNAGSLRPAWFRTIGAQLLFGARPHERSGLPDQSLDFLRLVHASPLLERQPALAPLVRECPVGWVWEHVAGARLEAHAAPGTRLAVDFEVDFGSPPYRVRFLRQAFCDADGVARLRVPYATRGTNGDGIVRGQPRWTLGEVDGRLDVSEEDVLEGRVLRIP